MPKCQVELRVNTLEDFHGLWKRLICLGYWSLQAELHISWLP